MPEITPANQTTDHAPAPPADGVAERVHLAETDAADGAQVSGGTSTPPPASATRSIGRQSLVYAAGEFAGRVVSFLMLPITTRYLSPTEYGVVSQVDMLLNLLAIVAGARLSAGISRFYHKADTPEARNAVVSTAFLMLLLLYTIAATLVFAAATPLARLVLGTTEYATALRVASALFAASGVLTVPFAFLVVTERPTAFVVSSVAKLVLHATLNVVFLAVLGLGVLGAFLGALISTALFAVGLSWMQVRATGLAFSRPVARDLARFWWPLIFTQLALFVLSYGARPFLQAAGGLDEVGLYALATTFGVLLVQAGFSPFARVWESVRFKYAKLPAGERDAPFARAFVTVNVTLVSAGVLIVLFSRDFLRIFSSPLFVNAATMVPALVIAYLLQSWALMHEVGILVAERTGYTTLANWIASGIALAGFALLIPRLGGQGAAIATALSMLARWGVTYASSQHLWPVRYAWAPVARVGALGVVVGAAGLSVPGATAIPASIALHALLAAAYVAALWHIGVIDEPVRQRILAMLRSPRAVLAGFR